MTTTSSNPAPAKLRQRGSKASWSLSSSLRCVQTLRPSSRCGSAAPSHPASVVWHCVFSTDGLLLACCHGAPDACVRVWKRRLIECRGVGAKGNDDDDDSHRTAKRERSGRVGGEEWYLSAVLSGVHQRTIRSAAFAPSILGTASGYVLASASFDGTVAIWESFDTGDDEGDGGLGDAWECTAQLEGHESEVKDVVFNNTGTLLATCGRDKSVWIWECSLPGRSVGSPSDEVGEGEFDCLAVLHGHEGDVKCVSFAPSHGLGASEDVVISASYDDTIRIWVEDVDGEWYCHSVLPCHRGAGTIWTAAVWPGGSRLVSGCDDGSIGIWRYYTSAEICAIEKEQEGSDDLRATTSTKGTKDGLWKCVGVLGAAHSRPVYGVHCAPARAGHGRIVSGGGDDCIRVYREVVVSTGVSSADNPKFTLDALVECAHDGDVNCVKWHPRNGSILASAGDDGAVKIWNFSCRS